MILLCHAAQTIFQGFMGNLPNVNFFHPKSAPSKAMLKINKLLKDFEDKKIWKAMVKFKLLLESEKSLEND